MSEHELIARARDLGCVVEKVEFGWRVYPPMVGRPQRLVRAFWACPSDAQLEQYLAALSSRGVGVGYEQAPPGPPPERPARAADHMDAWKKKPPLDRGIFQIDTRLSRRRWERHR